MSGRRWRILGWPVALYGLVCLAASGVGSLAYFHYGDPKNTCATCHEMGGVHAGWSVSAHQTLHCRNCHGGSLTLDIHALESHLRRVTQHLGGGLKETARLSERDVLKAHDSCAQCHPQSYAEWRTSRHTTTLARIFLDEAHNKAERVADDCLRCHGMFVAGEVKDLVRPLDKQGPWTLADGSKSAQPAIPCLACHKIHTPAGAKPLQFYDRRERMHFPVTELIPTDVREDGKPVPLSNDPRQRLCQQCHAPSAFSSHRIGTSDDRTPTGVHAGLSCLDCHQMHTTSARESCATCHPRNSHCGLDVRTMDTSFSSRDSEHNIHTVRCTDCHAGGRPVSKPKSIRSLP